jgi:hypothetical protein
MGDDGEKLLKSTPRIVVDAAGIGMEGFSTALAALIASLSFIVDPEMALLPSGNCFGDVSPFGIVIAFCRKNSRRCRNILGILASQPNGQFAPQTAI